MVDGAAQAPLFDDAEVAALFEQPGMDQAASAARIAAKIVPFLPAEVLAALDLQATAKLGAGQDEFLRKQVDAAIATLTENGQAVPDVRIQGAAAGTAWLAALATTVLLQLQMTGKPAVKEREPTELEIKDAVKELRATFPGLDEGCWLIVGAADLLARSRIRGHNAQGSA